MSLSPDVDGPRHVRIAGRSDSGKTTLIERLLPVIRSRGISTGTIKHAHHGFTVDRDGSDTFRHRAAGSEATALIGPDATVLFMDSGTRLDRSEVIARMRGLVQFVLVEGYRDDTGPAVLIEAGDSGATVRIEPTDDNLTIFGDPARLSAADLEIVATWCLEHGV